MQSRNGAFVHSFTLTSRAAGLYMFGDALIPELLQQPTLASGDLAVSEGLHALQLHC